MVIFFGLNTALYLGLGLFCALRPNETSSGIGFSLAHPSALSEYITVYGGLEIALGLFFALALRNPTWRQPALAFGLILYGCLALFRAGTLVFIEGLGWFPYTMFSIELGMAVFAGVLLMHRRRTRPTTSPISL